MQMEEDERVARMLSDEYGKSLNINSNSDVELAKKLQMELDEKLASEY